MQSLAKTGEEDELSAKSQALGGDQRQGSRLENKELP